MKVVIQRAKRAKCIVNEKTTGKIEYGLLLLVGFTKGDSAENIKKMVDKIIKLRIFSDEVGKMNLNIKQVGGQILSISQFTLYANTNKGNRPSFEYALDSPTASILYDEFNRELGQTGIIVEQGIFGADMKLDFINDGPITITLEF
ncbi:MAG: D-aminoacyl-tRNA deacylase [Bacilli bacterium]